MGGGTGSAERAGSRVSLVGYRRPAARRPAVSADSRVWGAGEGPRPPKAAVFYGTLLLDIL